MKKRTLILTTAAVCLAASLMLIINFSFRRAAEPAFLGDRFSAASVCAVREPTYEHMRERIKEYKKYREQIGKDARAQKPLPPNGCCAFASKYKHRHMKSTAHIRAALFVFTDFSECRHKWLRLYREKRRTRL